MRCTPPLRKRAHRSGFALMLVLVVVLINSVVMLGMFGSLHLQVAESKARQQTAVRQSVEQAAIEHAIALLLKDPSFKGDYKFRLPNQTDGTCAINVESDGKFVQVVTYMWTNGTEHKTVSTFSVADLDKRRKYVGM